MGPCISVEHRTFGFHCGPCRKLHCGGLKLLVVYFTSGEVLLQKEKGFIKRRAVVRRDAISGCSFGSDFRAQRNRLCIILAAGLYGRTFSSLKINRTGKVRARNQK